MMKVRNQLKLRRVIKYWYFRSLKRFWDCDFFCRCPWTSWSEHGRTKNDMYNKRVLIWHFTLVFMKSYAGNWQINCMTEQYRTIGSEIQGFLSNRRSFYWTCPSVISFSLNMLCALNLISTFLLEFKLF